MADPVQDPDEDIQGGLSEQEKRDNVIRLAFSGEPERFDTFCSILDEFMPPGTTVVLRDRARRGRGCTRHVRGVREPLGLENRLANLISDHTVPRLRRHRLENLRTREKRPQSVHSAGFARTGAIAENTGIELHVRSRKSFSCLR